MRIPKIPLENLKNIFKKKTTKYNYNSIIISKINDEI